MEEADEDLIDAFDTPAEIIHPNKPTKKSYDFLKPKHTLPVVDSSLYPSVPTPTKRNTIISNVILPHASHAYPSKESASDIPNKLDAMNVPSSVVPPPAVGLPVEKRMQESSSLKKEIEEQIEDQVARMQYLSEALQGKTPHQQIQRKRRAEEREHRDEERVHRSMLHAETVTNRILERQKLHSSCDFKKERPDTQAMDGVGDGAASRSAGSESPS